MISTSTRPFSRGPAVDHQPISTASVECQPVAWPRSSAEVEALVDEFAGRLVGYAFRQLHDYQEAEDVVQQVFIRAFVKPPDRREVGAVRPYLYRCVANACIDVLRRQNMSAVFREEIDTQQLLANSGGPPELAAAIEGMHRAESLLRRLPTEQAEAVRLRVFDGLRLSEIAEVLKCPVNTVCSRLRYGFQKLRSLVSTEGSTKS